MEFDGVQSVLEHADFDVVVVGAGAAGLTAAITAARRGASVVVLEAADVVGGTTAKSGGGFWIPGNRLMGERGFPESREACLSHMALLAYPADYDAAAQRCGLGAYEWEMIVNYFDRAAEAIEALEAEGDLTYDMMESFIPGDDKPLAPWYVTPPDGVRYGRLLAPTPVPRRTTTEHDATDVFTARERATAPDADEDKDYKEFFVSAATGDGVDLVAQLMAAVRRYGVTVVVGHRATDLVTDDSGAVVGVVADTPDGAVTVEARQGAVFGSGGMEFNRELRERHLRGPIIGSCGAPTNRGDFIAMATRVGAALGNMSEGWWGELPLEACIGRFASDDLMTHIHGDSAVLVNASGERVVNEKLSYHERSKAHFVRDATGGYPHALLFHVFDQAVVDDDTPWVTRWQVPYATDIPPHVVQGATLAELADALQARLTGLAEHTRGFRLQPGFARGLEATIQRFNAFARAGRDEDFGRGDVLSDQYFSPHVRRAPMPNHTMHPFRDRGPYYAVILGASTLGTKGGPKINTTSQVLRPDGTPIPGLYGAGNCIGSPAGEAYWGGGSTLGPAILHGYLAGLSVVREPVRAADSSS